MPLQKIDNSRESLHESGAWLSDDSSEKIFYYISSIRFYLERPVVCEQFKVLVKDLNQTARELNRNSTIICRREFLVTVYKFPELQIRNIIHLCNALERYLENDEKTKARDLYACFVRQNREEN